MFVFVVVSVPVPVGVRVRVFAARYLLKILPERALAALKDIEANATYEVRVTAGDVLRRHEHGMLET